METALRTKLTKTLIDEFSTALEREVFWDAGHPGFGVVVTRRGAKSYVCQYRSSAGRSRRLTIGAVEKISLDAARRQAKVLAGEVVQGLDPMAVRIAARATSQAARLDTFSVVAERFVTQHAMKHHKGWRETKRILDRDVVPKWGRRPISEMRDRDVIELLDQIGQYAPIQSNRTLTALRLLFNWCVDKRLLDTPPTQGVRPTPETARDRTLSDAELVAVVKAARADTYPFRPCVELLILTAQRRNEVAHMRWSEVDRERGVWTIPAARSKNGLAHQVQLSKQALAILDSLPRFPDCDLVFTTTGETSISGFSKLKVRLDKRSKVSDWILHDLRRTATTGMARMGIPPHVADKVLNHKSGTISGVAAVYNQFGYEPERRQALQAWADYVDALVTKTEANSIVPLRAA